jgi:hypothetical protein
MEGQKMHLMLISPAESPGADRTAECRVVGLLAEFSKPGMVPILFE